MKLGRRSVHSLHVIYIIVIQEIIHIVLYMFNPICIIIAFAEFEIEFAKKVWFLFLMVSKDFVVELAI